MLYGGVSICMLYCSTYWAVFQCTQTTLLHHKMSWLLKAVIDSLRKQAKCGHLSLNLNAAANPLTCIPLVINNVYSLYEKSVIQVADVYEFECSNMTVCNMQEHRCWQQDLLETYTAWLLVLQARLAHKTRWLLSYLSSVSLALFTVDLLNNVNSVD